MTTKKSLIHSAGAAVDLGEDAFGNWVHRNVTNVERTHSDGSTKQTFPVIGGCVFDSFSRSFFRDFDGNTLTLKELKSRPEYAAHQVPEWKGENGAGVDGFFQHGPQTLSFIIGDECNASCVMCPHNARRKLGCKTWPNLPWKTLKDVVAKLPTLQTVELVNFGETFLHPGIAEILNVLTFAEVQINIITNGSLLHSHIDTLATTPGWLTFSIDEADPERYAQIRRGLNLPRVLKNLQQIIDHPDRHRSRHVGINMTVWKRNYAAIEPVLNLAVDHGCDYVVLLIGQHLEETEVGEGQDINEVIESDDFQSYVEQLREGYPQLTIKYSPLDKVTDKPFCPIPWHSYDIGPDGNAHICQRSYKQIIGRHSDDIWNGKDLTLLRDCLLRGGIYEEDFPVCAECRYLGTKVRVRRKPVED